MNHLERRLGRAELRKGDKASLAAGTFFFAIHQVDCHVGQTTCTGFDRVENVAHGTHATAMPRPVVRITGVLLFRRARKDFALLVLLLHSRARERVLHVKLGHGVSCAASCGRFEGSTI